MQTFDIERLSFVSNRNLISPSCFFDTDDPNGKRLFFPRSQINRYLNMVATLFRMAKTDSGKQNIQNGKKVALIKLWLK